MSGAYRSRSAWPRKYSRIGSFPGAAIGFHDLEYLVERSVLVQAGAEGHEVGLIQIPTGLLEDLTLPRHTKADEGRQRLRTDQHATIRGHFREQLNRLLVLEIGRPAKRGRHLLAHRCGGIQHTLHQGRHDLGTDLLPKDTGRSPNGPVRWDLPDNARDFRGTAGRRRGTAARLPALGFRPPCDRGGARESTPMFGVADETERPNETSEAIGPLGPHKAIGERSPIAFVAAGEQFADGLPGVRRSLSPAAR